MQLAINLVFVLCNVNYCKQTDDEPVFLFLFINYVDCILFVILSCYTLYVTFVLIVL